MKRLLLISFAFFGSLILSNAQQGALDPTFNGTGYVNFDGGKSTQDRPYGVGIQPNGKIVVCGSYTPGPDYTGYAHVMRYNTDGTLDENFGVSGIYAFEEDLTFDVTNFYDMDILAGGGIIAAGAHAYRHFFSPTDSLNRRDFLVVKLKSDGTPDESFANSGVGLYRIGERAKGHLAYTVKADAIGNIYVAGFAYSPNNNSQSQNVLMKILPDGNLDTSYGNGTGFYAWQEGSNNSNSIYDIAINTDGSVVVVGDSHVYGEGYVPFMAKINPTGTNKDITFGSFGSVIPFATGYFESVLIDDLGNIYACGYEENGNGTAGMIYAYNNKGKTITAFGTNGRLTLTPDEATRLESIIQNSRGKYVVAGSAGTYGLGGATKVLTAVFDDLGQLDPSWGEDGIKVESRVHPSAPVNIGTEIKQGSDGKYVLAVASFFGDDANDVTVVRYNGFNTFEFSSTAAKCSSSSDGALEVTVADGAAPFQYSLDGSNYQSNAQFNNLAPGTYSLYVKDNNANVSMVEWAKVLSPSPLTATYNAQGDQIVILANGGTPPYMYSIDGTNFQSSASFSGWNGDDSNILVKDANDCRSDASVGIAEAQMAQAIQLYPNPVIDLLNVNAGQAKLNSFTLTDVRGRIILNENLSPSATQQIDLSNLDFGVYTLILRGDFGTMTRQILKK